MVLLEQWEDFQAGADTVDVGTQVLQSWRRSQWSGIHPQDMPIPQGQVPPPDRSGFHDSAPAVLDRMTDQFAGTRTALVLADRRARVLWRWVDDTSLGHDLDGAGLIPGAVFSEEQVGTNGIGTALESHAATVIVGPAHFVNTFHRWACAAVPVRHPVTGKVVGVVNVSRRADDADDGLRWAAQALAEGVGGALRTGLDHRELRLHRAFSAARRHVTRPVLAIDAHTFIADDVASALGLDHHTLWRLVHEYGPDTDFTVRQSITARARFLDRAEPAAGAIVELTLHEQPTPGYADHAAAGPLAHHLSPLELAEYQVLAAALREANGNKVSAAATLEISRGTLYQKIKKYRRGSRSWRWSLSATGSIRRPIRAARRPTGVATCCWRRRKPLVHTISR